MTDDFLIVGRVRRAHGLQGEVLITVDTDRPGEVFRRGGSLRLGDSSGKPVGAPLTLERVRPTTGALLLKLAGVATREDADALRGHTLVIAAADAAPSAEDEIHQRELVGLSAFAAGTLIGKVESLLENPGADLLVVRGTDGREVLIPFVAQFVKVDLEKRELRLELPEGLLEL